MLKFYISNLLKVKEQNTFIELFHSSPVLAGVILIGDWAILDNFSSWGEAAKLIVFFVEWDVLKPRRTHFSRFSMWPTFSKLFFIMFVWRVWIKIFSRSRIVLSIFSSFYSFWMIDSLLLRILRFSRTCFFVMSSSLSLRSSCLSISSWF